MATAAAPKKKTGFGRITSWLTPHFYAHSSATGVVTEVVSRLYRPNLHKLRTLNLIFGFRSLTPMILLYLWMVLETTYSRELLLHPT